MGAIAGHVIFPKKSLRPLMHCGNNNNSAPVKPRSNCWDDYFCAREGREKSQFLSETDEWEELFIAVFIARRFRHR